MFFKKYVEKKHQSDKKYHDLFWDNDDVCWENPTIESIHRSMGIMMGKILRNIYKRKTGKRVRLNGLYSSYPFTILKHVYEKLETHEDVDMFVHEYEEYEKKIMEYIFG